MKHTMIILATVALILGCVNIATAAPVDVQTLFTAEAPRDIGPGQWSTDGAFQDVGATAYQNVFLFDHVLDYVREVVRDFQAGNGDSRLLGQWNFWEDHFRFEDLDKPPETIHEIKYVYLDPPAPIPLPPAAYLFLTAIAGLFVARRTA